MNVRLVRHVSIVVALLLTYKMRLLYERAQVIPMILALGYSCLRLYSMVCCILMSAAVKTSLAA